MNRFTSERLTIERFTGSRIASCLDDLARLRITVFREFPYLYEGDSEYEKRYLQTYVDSPDSVLVIVSDDGRVVGGSTAIPLSHETAEIRKPFERRGYDVGSFFYLAESVLLPEYRGRGLGVRFFEEREAYARSLNRFEWSCFCAVERPYDHRRRPSGFTPLDQFWRHRGYEKHPELRTLFAWQDLDESSESPKPMVFWLKSLKG